MTLIYNARFAGDPAADRWVLISAGYIVKIGRTSGVMPAAEHVVDAEGALLLPGVIDCHVHFREPGLTAKADIATESRAAVAGGVTSYMDMPNCLPQTTTLEAWAEKEQIAQARSMANYAFFLGATSDNLPTLIAADYTRVPGVKLFMGSSTGNMLVDDDSAISAIFRQVPAIVAVHAEDQSIVSANAARARAEHPGGVPMAMHSAIRSVQACYACAKRAVDLARLWSHRLHICHLSTKAELALLQKGVPLEQKLITSEVSPHHLLWCSDDYPDKGARIKMNPSVKSPHDRDALRQALADGLIDMVATDHAPHLPADKQGDALTAASGAPMVQFSLVAMLSMFDEQTVQRVMCQNPAIIYGIKDRGRIAEGCYADLALVREVDPYLITDSQVLSKCGWTPLDGLRVRHRVERVWVNGQQVYDHGIIADAPAGRPLRFKH